MKLPMAGQKVNAFVVSDDNFGEVSLRMTPAGIAEHIGTKKFTIIFRYFYSLHVAICYRDEVPEGTQPTVYGDERIKGAVLIFGYDDSLRSLNKFEIELLRSCAVMMKLGGENRLLLGNMTKKQTEPPIGLEVECAEAL